MKGDLQINERADAPFPLLAPGLDATTARDAAGPSSSFGTDNSVPGFTYFGRHTWQLSNSIVNEFAAALRGVEPDDRSVGALHAEGYSTPAGSARYAFPSFSWGARPGTSFNNVYKQFRNALSISAG